MAIIEESPCYPSLERYLLLERMKASVDEALRENQAGFRKGRSCIDQIATLRIIIEQSEKMEFLSLDEFH